MKKNGNSQSNGNLAVVKAAPTDKDMLRDYLDEKRWEFAIKWERGGGEGAQKEMRRRTATLPRVTKCLWFEFNLHSRFIRAPPISR